MNPEQQLCSLELAKKLGALGVLKHYRPNFYWRWFYNRHSDTELHLSVNGIGMSVGDDGWWSTAPAFSVAELGEMLPPVVRKLSRHTKQDVSLTLRTYPEVQFEEKRTKWRSKGYWCGYYATGDLEALESFSLTEADARAKMLICLLENKLITLNHENQPH